MFKMQITQTDWHSLRLLAAEENKRADSAKMESVKYDYALLGLGEDDVIISGPFEDALGTLNLIARASADDAESQNEEMLISVQHDKSKQRASLMVIFMNRQNGDTRSTIYLMLPIPAVEDRDTVMEMTDLGRWQLEMDYHLNTLGEDNA